MFILGYNATILAYGQTGSGKTHTMGGNYEDSLGGDEEGMGVIPRVLRDIFVGIQDNETYDYTVRISYMEVSFLGLKMLTPEVVFWPF